MSKKGPVEGLSWLQLAAGALAAMTSAWIASYLGVAGTVIGAAVGSLTAAVATALYSRGIDRGTTLITKSGSVVSEQPVEPTADEDTRPQSIVVTSGEDEDAATGRSLPWRRIVIVTAVALVVALAAIGAYEFATGRSWGDPENPGIGSTFDSGSDSGDSPEDPAPSSEPTTAPTTAPTTGATTPPPAPEPEPTTAPTTTAPTTAPTEGADGAAGGEGVQ